jgi:hypothetical protein
MREARLYRLRQSIFANPPTLFFSVPSAVRAGTIPTHDCVRSRVYSGYAASCKCTPTCDR